jgi:hypothetical protein
MLEYSVLYYSIIPLCNLLFSPSIYFWSPSKHSLSHSSLLYNIPHGRRDSILNILGDAFDMDLIQDWSMYSMRIDTDCIRPIATAPR